LPRLLGQVAHRAPARPAGDGAMSNGVKAWSYSAWANYDLCPLQFKLRKIDKLPEPEAAPLVRGNQIHKGVADFIVGKAASLPRDVLKHDNMVSLIQELHAIPAQSKQVEQQWGFRADFEPTGWFGADTWFRSVLDAGVMYDDMTYEDVDWKTGKRYSKSNDDQMETQALSVMFKFKPVKHVTTRLAYLDTGEFEFAEFPATHREKLATKWRNKVAPMFKDTVFAPKPNEKCRFCHFSRSNTGKCSFG
jgi:hypothetical protein